MAPELGGRGVLSMQDPWGRVGEQQLGLPALRVAALGSAVPCAGPACPLPNALCAA